MNRIHGSWGVQGLDADIQAWLLFLPHQIDADGNPPGGTTGNLVDNVEDAIFGDMISIGEIGTAVNDLEKTSQNFDHEWSVKGEREAVARGVQIRNNGGSKSAQGGLGWQMYIIANDSSLVAEGLVIVEWELEWIPDSTRGGRRLSINELDDEI